jgi:hypothetical protein
MARKGAPISGDETKPRAAKASQHPEDMRSETTRPTVIAGVPRDLGHLLTQLPPIIRVQDRE